MLCGRWFGCATCARGILDLMPSLVQSRAGVTVAGTSERDWPVAALLAVRLVSFAVICAALYLGQAVLVPLVLAASSRSS